MPVNVNEIIRKLSRAERKEVENRAAELIAEEMSLRDLRKARKLTQTRVAKTLGITQDSVSRLEKRTKPWVARCTSLPSCATARRSSFPTWRKNIRVANRLEDGKAGRPAGLENRN